MAFEYKGRGVLGHRARGRRRRIGFLALAAGVLVVCAARAQDAVAGPHRLDSAAVVVFIDSILPVQLERFRIPGGVVAVVQGTDVVALRGFGYASLETKSPIDPERSMFHIGSTGKLITWTAAMQLVEQGRVELDRDLNDYWAPFRLPERFGAPLTLRHLMTHTAGFEEGALGFYLTLDTTRISTIEDLVTGHTPSRVRPPGQLSSYSNFGAVLAGFLVERVSGEPFADYVERHVYAPLGIEHSTFREPLPPALAPFGVTGYSWDGERFLPEPYEIDGGWTPAGGTSMSAGDMARFMIAHLNQGSFQDAQLLAPAAEALMQRVSFRHDPRLPGVALGFIEQPANGHYAIGHDGDSFWFHTTLVLLPEERLGIFASYVGDGGTAARAALTEAFFDRFYPAEDSVLGAPSVEPSIPLDRYGGSYRTVRMSYTKLDKIVWLFQPTIEVAAIGGELSIRGPGATDTATRYRPVGEHLFQRVGGAGRVAFAVDGSGIPSRVFFGSAPTVATERVPWSERAALWVWLMGGAALISLAALVAYPLGRKSRGALSPALRHAERLAVMTAGLFWLTLLVMVGVSLGYGMSLLGRIPLPFQLMLALPLGFVVMTVVLLVAAVRAWRAPGGAGRRTWVSVVALAALVVCWFFATWNVLGWRLG